MQLGVFIPIGNNGWLISTTSPQYMPSFDLNRAIVEKAERFNFDFALSMIKLHGFGGPSQFWDHNLEFLHLDGRPRRGHHPHSAVRHLRRPHHAAADHGAHGGDDRQHLARPVRREHHLRLAAARILADGHLARFRALQAAVRVLRRVRDDHARAVGDGPFRSQGQLLPNGRLSLQPASHGSNPRHLRWAERCRNALCRAARRLQFLLELRREPAHRRRRRASRAWSPPPRRPGAIAAP